MKKKYKIYKTLMNLLFRNFKKIKMWQNKVTIFNYFLQFNNFNFFISVFLLKKNLIMNQSELFDKGLEKKKFEIKYKKEQKHFYVECIYNFINLS